jgi:hypothetical protein
MIFDDNSVTGTDNATFGNDHVIPDKQNPLFRFFIFRMEIDARISLDPDMVTQMDESRPVDHDP